MNLPNTMQGPFKKKKKKKKPECTAVFPCNLCVKGNPCTQCIGGRGRDPKPPCHCLQGFYQGPNKQVDCQECNNKCSTCQNNPSNCLTCKPNRINPPSCHCKQGTFEQGGICLNCHPKCQSCKDTPKQCSKCSKGQGRSEQNPCNCIKGYYELDFQSRDCECRNPGTRGQPPLCACLRNYFSDSNKDCIECPKHCETCEHPLKCKICKQGENRSMLPPFCGCKQGYYPSSNSDNNCIKCPPLCKSCINENQCTECEGDLKNRKGSPDCSCNDGYYDINKKCEKCGFRCSLCVNEEKNCSVCKVGLNRSRIPPQCGCLEGYFEIDNQINCLKCKPNCKSCERSESNCLECSLNRSNPPECKCRQGYFEQGEKCLQCDFRCLECTGTKENCTKCKEGDNRTMESPSCGCQEGFFDDGKNIYCQKCEYPCSTCIKTPFTCIECGFGLHREDPPSCLCKPGYDDFEQICTKECYFKCEKCNQENKKQCTTCSLKYPYYILNENKTKKCYSYCPENYESEDSVQKNSQEYQCICQKEESCDQELNLNQLDEIFLFSGLGYTNKTKDGKPQRCEQQGCQKCHGLPPSLCSVCKIGYYLSSKQICQLCHPSCESCSGPLISDCLTCNVMLISSMDQINQQNCMEYTPVENTDQFLEEDDDYDDDEYAEDNPFNYDNNNNNKRRRILKKNVHKEYIPVFKRYLEDDQKIILNDSRWRDTRMRVKGELTCRKPCISIPQLLDDSNFFSISEKGHTLIFLSLMLDIAGIRKQDKSKYDPLSLNDYFRENESNIQVQKEYKDIYGLMSFLNIGGQPDYFKQNELPKYYYRLNQSFKLGNHTIGFSLENDLRDDIQPQGYFDSQCYALDSQKVKQAEKSLKNLDLDSFYIVSVCDPIDNSIKQGLYLRKEKQSKTHIIYDIQSGNEIPFQFSTVISKSTAQIQSYVQVKILRQNPDYLTINDVVHYSPVILEQSQAFIKRQKQGKTFDKCSTGEISLLDEQIIKKYNELYQSDKNDGGYIHIKEQLKKISQVTIDAPLPYLREEFLNDLEKALKDFQKQNPSIPMTINSCKRTFIGQYLLYMHCVKKRCGISIVAGAPGFRSNHIPGRAIDIGNFDNTTSTYGGKYNDVFKQYDMYWLGTKDDVHYNYKAGKISKNLLIKREMKIFQELWNCNYPEQKIDTDGLYGANTRHKILQTPADGFPNINCKLNKI